MRRNYEARHNALMVYHAKGAIKTKHGVKGLTAIPRGLVKLHAIVYFYAPYRGKKRLYIIDHPSAEYYHHNRETLKWGDCYFARRPFLEEIGRAQALGADIAIKAWLGFAIPGPIAKPRLASATMAQNKEGK
jgi:hypothetical protein